METSQGRPYGINEPGTTNSEVKPETFVETMIVVQELLKHSEYVYEKIYQVQKQINPAIVHEIGDIKMPIDPSHELNLSGNVSSLPDNARQLLVSPQIEGLNIFQQMTDIINKTHRELDTIERAIKFVYDSIGVKRVDDGPNATK